MSSILCGRVMYETNYAVRLHTPTQAQMHMVALLLRLNHMAADRQALCSDSATVLTN